MKAGPWIAAAAVTVLLVSAGCALTAPVTCDDTAFDPPAPLTCDAAIAAARQQLSDVAGVTALRFDYDVCPPNARCAFPLGATGNVIASLSDGTELGVFVSIDPEGIVRAEEPRSLDLESQPTPLP
jgi:hypothetical protein